MSGRAWQAGERLPRLAILGCRGIPARYGGFETFAEELGARLASRGFPVTVFCQATGEPQAPRVHRGVRLEYVRVPWLGPATALVYDLRALRRARAAHEVVYMLGYGTGAFLRLGRRPGNEVWVNMDGLEWRRSKWGPLARAWLRRAERAALASADRIVFDSHAVRRAVAGAADDGRTSVIEYGAELVEEHDPRVLDSLGVRARAYHLLVSRIEPENHVLEILRAHARSGVARALLVVGDVARAGRYGAACRAAAGRAARFLGPLFDRRTLYALRRECAAALHGHSVGGTNPALLEAMAAGAPLLAHDNPFTREVLEERGLYFGSEDELVELLRVVDAWSAEERARRGAANRARIAARYTWERITAEYARLLGEPDPVRVAQARVHPPTPAAALPAPRSERQSPVP
jgi:glycosyltransferase involved in cell wall biosynthesis